MEPDQVRDVQACQRRSAPSSPSAGDKMMFQAISGALPDQEIDQRQPPRLVHRFDQQFPIAIEIVFRRLIHPPGPRNLLRAVFRKAGTGPTASPEVSPGLQMIASNCQ